MCRRLLLVAGRKPESCSIAGCVVTMQRERNEVGDLKGSISRRPQLCIRGRQRSLLY